MIKYLKIYATTPESEPQNISMKRVSIDGKDYYNKVINTARWSEVHGFEGTLIYSNNSLADGWAIAQVVLEHTNHLTPLVAVNPVYIRPYALAKRIATISFMYGRRVDINWIAGGFQGDLVSLGEETPHDERYDKLFDYASLVDGLLKTRRLHTHEGKYYNVKNVLMRPEIPEEMIPIQLISGTSEAGLATAEKLGAVKVKYAKPIAEYEGIEPDENFNLGVRFGIIARETSDEAWEVANERYPDDMKGKMAHAMATKASDSNWHKDLSKLDARDDERNVYWLKPFHTYKTFCPYLVGSHDEVADELAKYVALGHTSIILDIMQEEDDFFHCRQVFETVELILQKELKKHFA
ncbi:MAG: LLM class flavin-dependent oxidoreductase [Bacteroidia bacterium]|nr:LLM class flavin-dependent oxidoreductase [Bacteroidia bacterium]NND12098.1 LLM class flavin-dependent oxidoreductase [Flavobacteriaceae bacterium]NNK28182.1 LLM class flavin-dependent oxidoreductase [Flavobacteriaceae bacterium]